MNQHVWSDGCPVRRPVVPSERERGLGAVIVLNAVVMIIEIAVGYATASMALLADGWHMATHVAALGLASTAYVLARRFHAHRGFVFGTGKIPALSGYTSALLLGVVAGLMVIEAAARVLDPIAVDFDRSLPVAIFGLLVNLASVYLLHRPAADNAPAAHGHGHGHGHHREHQHGGHGHEHHDHNHRAALLHLIGDALTSALAILALLGGRYLGWAWTDPVAGILGGAIILKWSVDLCRVAGRELLDFEPSREDEQRIRAALEALDGVKVQDLHVWSLGGALRGCIASITCVEPRDTALYREQILTVCPVAHLTVEVLREGAEV